MTPQQPLDFLKDDMREAFGRMYRDLLHQASAGQESDASEIACRIDREQVHSTSLNTLSSAYALPLALRINTRTARDAGNRAVRLEGIWSVPSFPRPITRYPCPPMV